MKNDTINKTILFKQRDETKTVSKYINLNTKSNVNTSKIIPFPKFRKRKKSSIRFYNNNKPLVIIAFLVLSICFISFVNNKLMLSSDAYTSKPTALTNTTDTNISTRDYKKYSKIISADIRSSLKLSSNYDIQTKSMHKNGSLIFARGTVSLPKDDPVYFDAILENNKMSSLVVNGVEYNK